MNMVCSECYGDKFYVSKNFVNSHPCFTPVTNHFDKKSNKLPITVLERVCDTCGFVFSSINSSWSLKDIAYEIAYQYKDVYGHSKCMNFVFTKYSRSLNSGRKRAVRKMPYNQAVKWFTERMLVDFGGSDVLY